MKTKIIWFIPLVLYAMNVNADIIYELDGSPYATHDAPVSAKVAVMAEKEIVVDPNEHVWGAYDAKGTLVRWGIATAGGSWCRDVGKSCKTKSGTFRISSLGDRTCVSKKFPIQAGGGAPMPYCMYFNGGQALHGSNEVTYGNESHGCVRMHVDDAKWLRYHFVEGPNAYNHYRGTKVIIKDY